MKQIVLSYPNGGRILASLLALLVGAPAAAQTLAQPADAFVESIGVNTHWQARNVYTTRYADLKAKLGLAGIRHVRDGAVGGVYPRATDLYATYGIRTTYITGKRPADYLSPLLPNAVGQELTEIKTNALATVAALEAPNEYDLFHDARETDWVGKIRAYTQALYAQAKADPALASRPVLGPSLTSEAAYVAVGDLDASLDHPCIHPYQSDRWPGTPGWGGNGYGSLDWNFNYLLARQSPSGKAPQATECGYATELGGGGVSEEAEGKYTARLYAEFFRRGIVRSFKYELVDEGTDRTDREQSFGLLRNDLSEKPAFRAVKSLIDVLADPGPAFAPTALAYALSGHTANVRQLLLQKRNGDFYLLLWLEVPSWDVNANQDLYPAAKTVTVTLPAGAAAQATAYALDNNANPSTAALPLAGNAFALAVTDKITAVKLTAPRPLAVSLTDFSAQVRGAVVELRWATAAEHQNRGFEVQRAGADGRRFEPLLFRAGAGNTAQPAGYGATDGRPLPGTSYYRLKQVDFDGKTQYSPVRAVTRPGAAVECYPNPVADRLTAFGAAPGTPARVHEASGRLVLETQVDAAGTLDLRALPPGAYLLSLGDASRAYRLFKALP